MPRIYKEINVTKSLRSLNQAGEKLSFSVYEVKYLAIVRALQRICNSTSYAQNYSIDATTNNKLITITRK